MRINSEYTLLMPLATPISGGAGSSANASLPRTLQAACRPVWRATISIRSLRRIGFGR